MSATVCNENEAPTTGQRSRSFIYSLLTNVILQRLVVTVSGRWWTMPSASTAVKNRSIFSMTRWRSFVRDSASTHENPSTSKTFGTRRHFTSTRTEHWTNSFIKRFFSAWSIIDVCYMCAHPYCQHSDSRANMVLFSTVALCGSISVITLELLKIVSFEIFVM